MANKYLSVAIAAIIGSIFVSLFGYDLGLGFIVSIIAFAAVGAATEWMASSEIKDIKESRKLSALAGIIAGLLGGILAVILNMSMYPDGRFDILFVLVIWIIMLVVGAIMAIVGATLMRRSLKPDEPGWPVLNTQAMTGSHVVYEKETIKEIVKIPCAYCGTLVENTASKCPSCGAPFKR